MRDGSVSLVSAVIGFRDIREGRQLSLGKLIEVLGGIEAHYRVVTDQDGISPGPVTSYLGFAEDLAFEPVHTPRTVRAVRETLVQALGAGFIGYEGGEYWMDRDTPLWLAPWGQEGRGITGWRFAAGDEMIELTTRDFDSTEYSGKGL